MSLVSTARSATLARKVQTSVACIAIVMLAVAGCGSGPAAGSPLGTPSATPLVPTAQPSTTATLPKAPTNLTATPASYTSALLKWQNNATNATGAWVEVYQPRGWSVAATLLAYPAVAPESWTFQRLKSGTYYCVAVVDYNAAGGAASNIACFSTPNLPPPPTNFSETNYTETSITFQWINNATNADYIWIDRWDAGVIATVPAKSGLMLYTDTGLQPGSSYMYSIWAHTPTGESSETTNRFETGPRPPIPPTNLTVSNVEQTSMSIEWQDNSKDFDGFAVFFSASPYHPSNVLTSGFRTGQLYYAYDPHKLKPSTSYCFYVRAYRNVTLPNATHVSQLYSAATNTLCATTLTPQSPPPPPPAQLRFKVSPMIVDPSTSTGTGPTWDADTEFEVAWEVCNYGGSASPAFTDEANLTAELPDGTSYTQTYTFPESGLAAGACVDEDKDYTDGLPTGQYTWDVYVAYSNGTYAGSGSVELDIE